MLVEISQFFGLFSFSSSVRPIFNQELQKRLSDLKKELREKSDQLAVEQRKVESKAAELSAAEIEVCKRATGESG